MTAASTSSRTPPALWAGLVLFIGILVYVVISSLTSHDALVFELSPVMPADVQPGATVTDTITVDARDPEHWVFFDFARRSVVRPPDTSGWDLAFRRFSVVPSHAALDAGDRPFDELTEAPEGGYVESVFQRDTINAATDRWYNYSVVSHLMSPKPNTYVIRDGNARFAKVEFLSYYCPGPEPGCITFRYVYNPDGARDLT